MKCPLRPQWLLFSLIALAGLRPAAADEGMWLFNAPPTRILETRYQFQATGPWLEHLQRSSVRFNSGGSGSFVSSDGLVMTNHHVGADALQKLSTPEHNYLRDGFHAKSPSAEVKCLDLELNVLQSIEDVTARVNAAVKPGMVPAEAQQARRGVMSTIEDESAKATGLRSDVITLYHGGRYHLYRFKKYTDVRLVFAPEQAIAFFGGDPDNFEYPRYDLDICFFRVYENGRPAKIEHFLRWSKGGAADGELVFVSGHPGRTDRLNTVAHLEFMRDRMFPSILQRIFRREIMLRTFSERGTENARRAQDELFGYQNSRKARLGVLAGLMDPPVLAAKNRDEKKLREGVGARPQLARQTGTAWDEIRATLETWRTIYDDYMLLETAGGFNSELFLIARSLVRMADESARPTAQRLREYRESNLDSLRQAVFSEAPIYSDLEIVKLGDSLMMLAEMKGVDDPLVRKVLAGRSPQDRAAQLVQGTGLRDVGARKKLADGGLKGIESSPDPMIQLARLVDAPSREVRRVYEEKVEEPQRQAYGRIAQARFAVLGTEVYPDATFTLRLAFGQVRGYNERAQQQPPWTTIGGAYRHAEAHQSKPPFALPQSWLDRKDRLDLDTPMNFVFTADIIGGNSGSPVVNRAGELVGIVFDGNPQSLVWDVAYTDVQGRAIAVHSAAIQEALRKIYGADALADALGR